MNVKLLAVLVVIAIAGISCYFVLKDEEKIPAPAEFEVSNLVLYPTEVEAGEPVTISATVGNVGDLSGTYTATLKINDVVEATKEVTVAGRATENVSFTVTKDTIGTYTIEVDGLQRVLGVLKPALKVGKVGYFYSTIQEALNDAQPEDRVKVMDGATYEEPLTVPLDNITLDLNGATVKGTHVESQGIWVSSRSDVAIKNGIVQNFADYGIALSNSDHITIENVRVENNRFGILLWNSNYNAIVNNVFTNNKSDGIKLENASSHNTISNNYTSWNGEGGVSAYHESNYNVVENNLASNQKYEFGINFGHFSDHNQIINNTTNSNYWSGIIFHDNCDNNVVENNVANLNRGSGIAIIFGSSYNVVQNNTALNNVATQINEDESCEGNIFLNNTTAGPGEPLPEENMAQNDAGLGRDASNNESNPDNITPGNYTGYLDNLDIYDCYKIYLNGGQAISIVMTPPAGTDFDLILYDPNLGWVEGSLKFGSGAESVSSTATSSGYYSFRIRQWSGAGTYSFSLSTS